jgi:hypothetical protein
MLFGSVGGSIWRGRNFFDSSFGGARIGYAGEQMTPKSRILMLNVSKTVSHIIGGSTRRYTLQALSERHRYLKIAYSGKVQVLSIAVPLLVKVKFGGLFTTVLAFCSDFMISITIIPKLLVLVDRRNDHVFRRELLKASKCCAPLQDNKAK